MNYLLERQRVLSTIELLVETINNRLIASFDGLENEADKLCEKIPFEIEDHLDEVWHTRERHLKINSAMKQELLNNACVWLFHLFEKDCKKILKTDNGTKKNKQLEELGISTDQDTVWWKINVELRLVANTVKHGEGNSKDELEKIRPDIFDNNPLFFSSSHLKISSSEFNNYSEIMMVFWSDYFKKARNIT